MGNSVTVAQMTLDHLVKVRILIPQPTTHVFIYQIVVSAMLNPDYTNLEIYPSVS